MFPANLLKELSGREKPTSEHFVTPSGNTWRYENAVKTKTYSVSAKNGNAVATETGSCLSYRETGGADNVFEFADEVGV